jgi:hypothetical protein
MKTGDQRPETNDRPASSAGWQSPVFGPWSLVLVCTLLLFLRKPWALHTPQFWAEDGEIFMKQDDAFGARAILIPYNGYLHLIPRLIAWTARVTADVAWWPAIYNGLAFVISAGVFARLASRRVELPAKHWLMLAFVLVVGTGEALVNVTNLQWFVAFFLLLQLFAAPPANVAQRLGDLAILFAVGLTGPFAIVFAPLFAWRAWCERRADNFIVLGAITLCAGVQGWFLLRHGASLSMEAATQPFRPGTMFSMLGSRLVTWPVLGPWAVRAWPLLVHAVIGIGVMVPLLVRSFRNDSRRRVRSLVAVAFVLVTAACAYRVRADTWANDNLVNGDRYFYISRVLLAWLLIFEFDARPRAVAYAARTLCGLGALMHLPHFIIPAPIDYKWAEHCDPIRRGEPANIYTLPEGWFIEYTGRPPKR